MNSNRLSLRFLSRIIYALCVLTFLSGCEWLQTRPQIANEQNSQLNIWQAKGKFSYSSNIESKSGNFDWRQEYDDYEVRLYGPLGLGTVRISGNNQSILVRSGNKSFESNNPQQLLLESTGLEIPINYLSKWMTGQTATSTATNLTYAKQPEDIEGMYIQQFSEAGWNISYDEYEQTVLLNDETQTYTSLPTKVLLQKGDIKLQLLTRSWSF